MNNDIIINVNKKLVDELSKHNRRNNKKRNIKK